MFFPRKKHYIFNSVFIFPYLTSEIFFAHVCYIIPSDKMFWKTEITGSLVLCKMYPAPKHMYDLT